MLRNTFVLRFCYFKCVRMSESHLALPHGLQNLFCWKNLMEGPTRPVLASVAPCRAESHVGNAAHVAAVSEWHSGGFSRSLWFSITGSMNTFYAYSFHLDALKTFFLKYSQSI